MCLPCFHDFRSNGHLQIRRCTRAVSRTNVEVEHRTQHNGGKLVMGQASPPLARRRHLPFRLPPPQQRNKSCLCLAPVVFREAANKCALIPARYLVDNPTASLLDANFLVLSDINSDLNPVRQKPVCTEE